ncbi:hypothetical protein Bca52824_092660 [Brassica carinata]|uniref:Uncharacterized protein n=1 Tax=Brassica carinata TaxID=52824 RepID=A0A8X7NS04_BRACI|nr:hypothetical protein Bca52824_092660 [Brassica carinata]
MVFSYPFLSHGIRSESFSVRYVGDQILIYRQIGTQRADSYFHHLGRFFASRITKPEFDKLCLKTIGRQHISLHNRLIRSIIKNASVAKSPPSRVMGNRGMGFVVGSLETGRARLVRSGSLRV